LAPLHLSQTDVTSISQMAMDRFHLT